MHIYVNIGVKEALGTQECSPTSQNVSTVVFRGKKLKIHSHNIFMFLKTGEPGEWDKLWS